MKRELKYVVLSQDPGLRILQWLMLSVTDEKDLLKKCYSAMDDHRYSQRPYS